MGIIFKSKQNKNNFNEQGATIRKFKFYFQRQEIKILKRILA